MMMTTPKRVTEIAVNILILSLAVFILSGCQMKKFNKEEPAPAKVKEAKPQQVHKPKAATVKAAKKPAVIPKISNPIAKVAYNNGSKACVGMIDKVTKAVTRKAPASAKVFIGNNKGQEDLFSVSLEANHPNVTVYSTASFSESPNGCSSVYEEIGYSNVDCNTVAKKLFAKHKDAGNVRKDIKVFDLPGNSKAFLMPAGKGCLTIRKTMVSGK